jgi:RES domain-containing protein
MIHDPVVIDRLSRLPTEVFSGSVFRATRRSLDPTTASVAGGRWSPTDGPAVLYTSFAREGALAEIAFHWAQFNPRPTKPAVIHQLGVRSERTLRLVRSTLEKLGVSADSYEVPNYGRSQEIGAAVSFLGCDGLIIPSARWTCENLVLFTDNLSMNTILEVQSAEEVDWQQWAKSVGFP